VRHRRPERSPLVWGVAGALIVAVLGVATILMTLPRSGCVDPCESIAPPLYVDGSPTPYEPTTGTPTPTGTGSTATGASATPRSMRPSTNAPVRGLPSSFRWSSSGALVGPKSDGRGIAGVKDPSVVYYRGQYHVFATVAKSTGYGLVYFAFADWSQANNATFYYLDQTPIGGGYRSAPEVFYFAPQHLWYLIFQNGNAAYSTNPDISNPAGWSAPRTFFGSRPDMITQNMGSGYWVDMWVICDSAYCYLFSSDENGHLYRSQTALADFPNKMTEPVIAAHDANKFNLFEGSNVYKVSGTNQYLLIVEGIGSGGRLYFRSWTSTSLAGSWSPLAANEDSPFARHNNVTFPGGVWTSDIGQGEMVRTGADQTLTISPCTMRYVYGGLDPSASGDYNSLPWRLGLLTQTNSTCG
jgi:hypothetical protein